MKISYTNDAFQSLLGLVNFIESKNTKGAGSRWLKKYEISIKEKFIYHDNLSFCKNITFHKLKLK
jgi:predicted SprT family Zn-dependent metalloprotease